MKIGDLVKYKNLHGHVVSGKFVSKSWTGILIEHMEDNEELVLWSHGHQETVKTEALQVINESR